MGKTKISWTDRTWNPTRGCTRVSEGCRNCYAERFAARFAGPGQPYDGLVRKVEHEVRQIKLVNGEATGDVRTVTVKEPRWTGEVTLVVDALADPLRWRKPQLIFVDSMSDLFHEGLTNEQIAAVFGVMAAAPQHTFQVLTKRAKRMREWFSWAARQISAPQTCIGIAESTIVDGVGRITGQLVGHFDRVRDTWPLPNVWLGVSVEDQAAADSRIPDLLATPAAVRFLSCEPLIGPVDLRGLDRASSWSGGDWLRSWRFERHLEDGSIEVVEERKERIDWVIVGCESGPGARPCSVEWLRSLRDQCAAAGTAFFLKQATPAVGSLAYDKPLPHEIDVGPGSTTKPGFVIELPCLDGHQHAAFPDLRTR